MFIEINDVCKSYGNGESRARALKNLNLGIEEGDIVAIVGASGSGKSTLLNVLGGLTNVDSGTIMVDGDEISAMNHDQLVGYRQQMLGFVFQFYNLIPDLTVYENIQVCQNLSPDPLDIDELLTILGIPRLRNRFPSELSGGQQQRVAIARALVKNPRLLLCDEPTGALDSKSSLQILELLEQINKQFGTTMLMVTHNEEIAKMADHRIRMKDGQIIENELNFRQVPAAQLEL